MPTPRKKASPPGKADKPDGAPGATNGEPNEDELERRRRERAGNGGTSVAERTAASDEDEPELFPAGSLDGDSKVTLKNLIKSGSATEATASMGTASVPIKGSGFFDPESEVTLLVRCLPGGIVPVATREKGDEKHKIKKWRLNQPLTPIYVQDAGSMYTREQVLEMLEEVGAASATISRLLGDAPAAAQG